MKGEIKMEGTEASQTIKEDDSEGSTKAGETDDVFNENIEFKHDTLWPGTKTLAAVGKFNFRKKTSSLYDGSLQLHLANGELLFPRGKNNLHVAKYTYVPTGTNSLSVLNYLLETANLKLPMLGFSIPHTSQKVSDKPDVMDIFHGIIQTAINMNAWILTCGTENSVPSAVSMTLKEHIIKYESKPVTIGIVPTSYLKDDDIKAVLDGKSITYNATTGDQLDATHSHFIMIASDTNIEKNAEITMKKKLEKVLSKGGKKLAKIRQSINSMNDLEMIASKKMRRQPTIRRAPSKMMKTRSSAFSTNEPEDTATKTMQRIPSVSSAIPMVEKIDRQNPIPIVVSVVGGDVESVVTLTEDLEYKRDTSTIMMVFEGSGGAADFLAFAVRNANEFGETSDEFKNRIRMRMKSFLFSQIRRGSNSKFTIGKEELFIYIQRFAALRRKVHICNCKSTRSEKLEKKIRQQILVALLEKVESQPREKLLLALVWNDADAVRNTLFKGNASYKISDHDLYHAMLIALERGNVEFVKLLVESGVSMEQFLTTERLEYLYNSCSTRTTPTFKDLLTLSNTLSVEGKIKFIKLRHVDSVIKFLMGGEFDSRYGRYASDDSAPIPHAFSELFLMAILCQQFSLADYFWQHGTYPIIKALVGMKIYSKLSEIAHGRLNIETASVLKSESEKYSEYAYDLLDICYDMHEKQTKKITIRRHDNWSRYSCLSLAVQASHMKFVAHRCCQAHMNDIWVGKLLTRKAYEVLLCCIFPPFLFSIKYKSDSSNLLTGENETSYNTKEKRKATIKDTFKSGMKKVNYFYTAPVVKFWMNVVSYMLFLLAFSYVVLKKLEDVPSVYEFFVIMYIVSLTIEEFRQMFSGKFRQWLADYWNIWDILAIGFFVVGNVLRWADSTVSTAKVLYAVDVCLWYVRLLDLFSVNSYLGTYVTMIGKMMYDTLRFLCIMLIFTAGYGVAREGVMHPEETDITFTGKCLAVLYVPYWQIYGELFLDDLQCGPDSSTGNTCVTGHYVVDIMTAVYLLIANILLLNMLIAIFNNIFTEYQENAEVIWKFERHRLVTEYMRRPVLVPPFMIFAHMWRLFKWTNRKRRKIVPKIFKKSEEEEVADDDVAFLDHWEEDMIKSYVNKETVKKERSTEHMIGELSERMLTISARLGEMDRRLQQLDEIDSKLDSHIRGMNDDDNNVSEQLNALDAKFNTLLDESGKQKERLANVQWAMLKLKKSCGSSRPVYVRRKSTGASSVAEQTTSSSRDAVKKEDV